MLFGEKYWKDVINWQALADSGTINQRDIDELCFTGGMAIPGATGPRGVSLSRADRVVHSATALTTSLPQPLRLMS